MLHFHRATYFEMSTRDRVRAPFRLHCMKRFAKEDLAELRRLMLPVRDAAERM